MTYPENTPETQAHPIDALRQMVADDIKRNGDFSSFMIRNGKLADLLDELQRHRQSSRVGAELRRFAQNIFNGLDTGMIKMDSPADETLANVLQRGRAALASLSTPAQPVDETERLRAWPTGLTQALREILGIPNFQCGPMAHAYQKIGEFSSAEGLALENRAEDEQAFILHKLLCIWFEHGDDWREAAIDEIDRAAKAARATLQHKGIGNDPND